MENNKKCGHEPSKGRENTLFGSSMDLGVIRIRWGCGGGASRVHKLYVAP